MSCAGKPPVGLSIAGFDPSSGAGVSADLQTFAAHGVFGACAITALTVQSTTGVEAVRPVEPEWLRRTLDVVCGDLPPEGIKIGVVGGQETLAAVAKFLQAELDKNVGKLHIPIVFDPVMQSSLGFRGSELSGGREGREAWLEVLHNRLLPCVHWITPNWAELQVLAGEPVGSLEEAAVAADRLARRQPGLNIVATGGESEPPVDLLRLADGSEHRICGETVRTRSTHGTGCAFSTALLCRLMQGKPPVEAVRLAKEFVSEALRQAPDLGGGRGPLRLLWPLQRSGGSLA